jgi:hypothetical protein
LESAPHGFSRHWKNLTKISEAWETEDEDDDENEDDFPRLGDGEAVLSEAWKKRAVFFPRSWKALRLARVPLPSSTR